MSDERQSAPPFEFAVKTTDSIGLILQMLLELRASHDAFVTLAIQTMAKDDDAAVKLAERHEELRKEFFLQYAFKLQDNSEGAK